MTTLSTSQTNRLRALLLSGDDTDKTLARGSVTFAKLDALARRRGTGDRPEQLVRTAEIRRLAINLRGLRRELLDGLKTLSQLVDSLAPNLQHRTGVGPVTAAQILVAWSHPGRVRNDAAFAALAGTCPLPASSGQRTRHRLNRGGDRALNSAIHSIAITRWRCCPKTRDYIDRRRAEGKTDREIRRCLKRYITRELHKALANP